MDSTYPRGMVRYALLVMSHPEQPETADMANFVLERLPVLKSQPDGNAKIGFLWITDPIDGVDMSSKALEAFGNDVADESKYVYRTLGFSLPGGGAKILVAYDIAPSGSQSGCLVFLLPMLTGLGMWIV